MGRAGSDVNPPRRQEDVKDPNALVAAQDRADNEALKSLTQAPIDALKRGVTAIRDYIMYTPEENQKALEEMKSKGYYPFKKGGKVKEKKVSTASKRADGIAQRGKTKGVFR